MIFVEPNRISFKTNNTINKKYMYKCQNIFRSQQIAQANLKKKTRSIKCSLNETKKNCFSV